MLLLLVLLLLLLFTQQHIIVFCGGNIYILPVTNSKGKYLSTLDLEGQFEWIQADVKHSGGENSPKKFFFLYCVDQKNIENMKSKAKQKPWE